ncbi:MAG TPA: pectinesterase family protein, partial [Polyangiaceae bacterium]|nr:pectinesterase family protein [Polyangiaceae bacterium]
MKRHRALAWVALLAPIFSAACSSNAPNASAPSLHDGSVTGESDVSSAADGQSASAGPADGAAADASAPGSADASSSDASLPEDAPAVCADTRPQLTDAEADDYTILGYLAQGGNLLGGLTTDDWNPTAGLGDITTFVPSYVVAADAGAYTSVQSAISAAVANGGANRVYIQVSPGTYRETVCVPANAPPITLFGSGSDPTQTVITYGNYNGERHDAGAAVNACTSNAEATYGTAGSATFAAFADDFEAINLTFSNDVSVATLSTTTGTQAVALMTEADKIVLQNVQVLGHQDTLYVETPSADTVVRVYVKEATISGDVDFIFGGATAVFDGCQIEFVSDRRATGDVLSPDTDSRNPLGFLVNGGSFTADANTGTGVVGLGRAWDRSCVNVPTYLSTCVASGDYPNGQAVVRGSALGPQVAADPW